MNKLLRVLLISVGLFMGNVVNLLPHSDDSIVPIEYYTEPVEILDLAKQLNIKVTELYKIKDFPIYSPISPHEINRISSEYGYRVHPIFKVKCFHSGVDYSAELNTPVRATANGIVKTAKRTRGYGKQILINHSNGYSTRYAHLNDIYVNPGDTICVGDTIGCVGNTGFSTGPHLHYEIRINENTINPLDMYPYKIQEENYMSYFDIVNTSINYSDNV